MSRFVQTQSQLKRVRANEPRRTERTNSRERTFASASIAVSPAGFGFPKRPPARKRARPQRTAPSQIARAPTAKEPSSALRTNMQTRQLASAHQLVTDCSQRRGKSTLVAVDHKTNRDIIAIEPLCAVRRAPITCVIDLGVGRAHHRLPTRAPAAAR